MHPLAELEFLGIWQHMLPAESDVTFVAHFITVHDEMVGCFIPTVAQPSRWCSNVRYVIYLVIIIFLSSLVYKVLMSIHPGVTSEPLHAEAKRLTI